MLACAAGLAAVAAVAFRALPAGQASAAALLEAPVMDRAQE
jgi:hypothetical protein